MLRGLVTLKKKYPRRESGLLFSYSDRGNHRRQSQWNYCQRPHSVLCSENILSEGLRSPDTVTPCLDIITMLGQS